jgi:hypothetical protein
MPLIEGDNHLRLGGDGRGQYMAIAGITAELFSQA